MPTTTPEAVSCPRAAARHHAPVNCA
jgi:hypothetical protein